MSASTNCWASPEPRLVTPQGKIFAVSSSLLCHRNRASLQGHLERRPVTVAPVVTLFPHAENVFLATQAPARRRSTFRLAAGFAAYLVSCRDSILDVSFCPICFCFWNDPQTRSDQGGKSFGIGLEQFALHGSASFSSDTSTNKSAAIFSSFFSSSARLHDSGMFNVARALNNVSPDIAALTHSVCSSSTFTP